MDYYYNMPQQIWKKDNVNILVLINILIIKTNRS